VYDRASLKLSEGEKNNLEKSGIKPYWRFKLPDNTTSFWTDLIMGDLSYNLSNVSDPDIIKADRTYLYTFTSVIDDFDHDITHVIRGQDHVTNTAVQIAMLNVISRNKRELNFAHLSLLVNKDGSQFSKRLGGLSLGDLKENGIDSMSVASLLATIGSSLLTVPFKSMDDLRQYFDITRFGNNSPKFDVDELYKLNRKILHMYSYDEILTKLGQEQHLEESIFEVVHENVEKISDFEIWERIFSTNFKNECSFSEGDKKIILIALSLLSEHSIDDLMQKIKNATGKNGKDLYMPIRVAITGLQHGPHITTIMKKLGIQETKRRLEKAIK
jgi:glutamyl-tRNA synthetase